MLCYNNNDTLWWWWCPAMKKCPVMTSGDDDALQWKNVLRWPVQVKIIFIILFKYTTSSSFPYNSSSCLHHIDARIEFLLPHTVNLPTPIFCTLDNDADINILQLTRTNHSGYNQNLIELQFWSWNWFQGFVLDPVIQISVLIVAQ